MKAIASQLELIVGSAGVCDWENIAPVQQQRILQATPNPVSCIVYPHTLTELAEVITCAHHHKWRVLPCGSSSKLNWGGLVDVQLVVSTERLNQLTEHAVGDLTVTVAAGAKFSELQDTLARSGQFLALDPTSPEMATMGGIVATADTGSWRQRYGGVRDQLLGINFVRADGEIAKAGGRVVKNVAGYDLMKLFTGSYGTLGIITTVTFRVYPLPEASATVVLSGGADAIAQALATTQRSALTPVAVDLLSPRLVTGLGFGHEFGLVARFASITESVKQQSERFLELGKQLSLQGAVYISTEEADLWQQLRTQIQVSTTNQAVTCKIGVLPSAAVALLTQLERVAEPVVSLIHAGSGLGLLGSDAVTVESVLEMRSLCQARGGFLSILKAPVALKQQVDVWGYGGNALGLMRSIKAQFDPENILSPHRFVGGI